MKLSRNSAARSSRTKQMIPNQLPTQLDIFDGSPIREKEQMSVRAFDQHGHVVQIIVHQRNSALFPDPGRVFVDSYKIDLRSEDEARLIELLETASFNPLKDDDERIGFVEIVPQMNYTRTHLKILTATIVSYIQSDEYARIAELGLDTLVEPWNLRRFPQ